MSVALDQLALYGGKVTHLQDTSVDFNSYTQGTKSGKYLHKSKLVSFSLQQNKTEFVIKKWLWTSITALLFSMSRTSLQLRNVNPLNV